MNRIPGQTDVNARPSTNPHHEAIRKQIEADVDAFLAKGGIIDQLMPDARKLPSRKLTNDERMEMLKRFPE